MKFPFTLKSVVPVGITALATMSYAADLSPANWPKAERERLEKIEAETWWSPLEAKAFESEGGIISATVSPIAVYAGVQALKAGGNAADAAATTALTQVTMQLGSVVSYAGIFTMLYYDAKDHKVYSMDAGYNSYLHETDPGTIPVSDLGVLIKSAPKVIEGGAKGRQTLVPGFMAGVEAMSSRFGHLPYRDLFAPAVWYAGHGVRISTVLQYDFAFRAKCLSLTSEGQQFMRQAGNELPKLGDIFVQPELARTLKAVSENGSRYMYSGQWGEDFVRIVQREGGKVTTEDMKRYEPTWNEPRKEMVFGHTVYVNGPPHTGAYALFVGMNMAEALKLDQKGPYWTDPEAFRDLARIGLIADAAPKIGKSTSSFLLSRGVDTSASAQLGKGYAQAVAPLLDQIFAPTPDNASKHSNAIVVVDRDGNVAVITHTINAVIWGDAGIVVDGIPIPDSAGFQQANLAGINPGDRVPNPIIDTIAFEGDAPVLGTASIGASLQNESIRVLLGILGQHQDLATVMAAPPLLAMNDVSAADKPASQAPISIPQGAYPSDFIAKLKLMGLNIVEIPTIEAGSRRGTIAAVTIDPKSGKRTAVDQPGVMVFSGTESN
jgi:gamma-glutamyltranspeptidase/glutathione hydrolase